MQRLQAFVLARVAALARRVDDHNHAALVLAKRLRLAAGQWLNRMLEQVRASENHRRQGSGDET